MTIKKFTIIAAAGALLLAGAIGISMKLTQPQEMELAVDAAQAEEAEETAGDLPKTLENMEHMPLYYNDRDLLLLPLRNVMEGLGGTVSWNEESRSTEISYHGKKLCLKPGETEATLNGYEITLPTAPEMINGCLYAEEILLTTYYTGDVVWDTDSEQILLQAKDHAVPVIAKKALTGERDGRGYQMELPVIVGLNDTNFEKSLNEGIRKELMERGEAFLAASAAEAEDMEGALDAAEAAVTLQLTLHTGLVSTEFISLWWEGSSEAQALYLTKNIDLVGQKSVTPVDLLEESCRRRLDESAGENGDLLLYLDVDGTVVVLLADAQGQMVAYRPEADGMAMEWKKAYRGILDATE